MNTMTPSQVLARRIAGLARALALPLALSAAAGLAACNHKVDPSPAGQSANANAPVVQASAPGVGPFSGGTVLTITGRNFLAADAGPNAVRIGGLLATDVQTVSDTEIRATTPAGTAGQTVDVVVLNALGQGRLAGGFSYLTPATVLSDLNADGIADMVVGGPRVDSAGGDSGAAYVFFGSDAPGGLVDRSAAQADVVVNGEAADDLFGQALTVGDVNGDGNDDLIVAAPLHDAAATDAGAVYVFHGPLTSSPLSAAQASVKLLGQGAVAGDRFGGSVAAGDLDGDGRAELIVGATRHDVGAGAGAMSDAGCVYVFRGGPSLVSMGAGQSWLYLGGLGEEDWTGNAVACGDVDGDRRPDLVLAACLRDTYLPPLRRDAGEAFVLCARVGFTGRTLVDADAVLFGEVTGDEFATSLTAGDVDGDGMAEMAFGTPLNDALGTNVGRVYLVRGQAALTSMPAANADVLLTGQPTNESFGMALTVGDMNGDGLEDLVAGAPMASFTHNGSGRAFVYLGSDDLTNRVATAANVIYNGEPFADDRCGSLVRVADVNRDGLADVLVSAPGSDAGGAGAGRVHVFLGSQTMAGQRSATSDDVTLTGSEAGGMFGSSMADGQ
jgi:hypothetical protein